MAGRFRPRVLTLAIDQGSIGWMAQSFLVHQGLCMLVQPDVCHRVANDSMLAIGNSGLRPHIVLLTVAINAPYGPWSGQGFWGQLQEVLKDWMAVADLSTDLLVESMRDQLLRDQGISNDGVNLADGLAVLRSWAGGDWAKGSKISVSRWFQFVRAAEEFDHKWHSYLLVLTFLGLRGGWLKKSGTQHELVGRLGSAGPTPDEKSTTRDGAKASASRLRDKCHNTLHVALCALIDPDAQSRTRMIFKLLGLVEQWFGRSNAAMRSLEGRQPALLFPTIDG